MSSHAEFLLVKSPVGEQFSVLQRTGSHEFASLCLFELDDRVCVSLPLCLAGKMRLVRCGPYRHKIYDPIRREFVVPVHDVKREHLHNLVFENPKK